MLARAGFGNDAFLPHPHGKQCLADGVVDLVRAGVIKVFTLEINLRAAVSLGEPPGKIQSARPANELCQVLIKLSVEFRVDDRRAIFLFQLLQRADQRFGNERSAIRAKPTA